MEIKIEVPDMNDSYSRIELKGSVYYLRFVYNDTYGYWTFGVYDSDKSPVVTSIKIVPNYPLNIFHDTAGMPYGVFYAQTELARIGRNDFKTGDANFVFKG